MDLGHGPWMAAPLIAALLVAGAPAAAGRKPLIFWASRPAMPGEVVMLVGAGLERATGIAVSRLADSAAGMPDAEASGPTPHRPLSVPALQVNERSVKFVLPEAGRPGIYALQVRCGSRATNTVLLNRPDLRWVQGDLGVAASPGGWVRGFGVGLRVARKSPLLLLRGARTVHLKAEGDGYALRTALPDDLPPGDYEVYVHAGCGGPHGWSEPRPLRVALPRRWPDAVYNVRDYGAAGDASVDDSPAVQAALDAIARAGGGVLYFPRGRYLVTQPIILPRFTVLAGEATDLTCLLWPDMKEPPEGLVHGANSFGVRDITLYCANHAHVLLGDPGSEPEAGDVFLRRVRVRANMYRGHVIEGEEAQRLQEIAQRFAAALRFSSGGPDTVRLGGANIEITDCDFSGSGRALYLSRVRGGLVARNRFANGRWGWYCISGSDGLIFEDNEIRGGDLMSTGGGINCLAGSSYSRNVYFARNTLRDFWGWDREAMTSDAGGGAYLGRIAQVDGSRLALAAEPTWGHRDWRGAGVFLLDGEGAGQYRRVADYEGRAVMLDRPFDAPPDRNTIASITMLQENYLIIGNQFSDATCAVQFYGISIGHVVAQNRSLRAGGFHNLGLNYYGFQPSWYVQYLDNEIVEGNGALGPLNQWPPLDSHLAVISSSSGEYMGPLARFAVLRRNLLRNNARIEVVGPVTDVVIEGNRIGRSAVGINISGEAAGVLLRGNEFAEVQQPLAGAGIPGTVVIPSG